VLLKRKHEELPEVLSEIVKSAVREEFSRQKLANQIRVSDLSERKINEILNNLGVKAIEVSNLFNDFLILIINYSLNYLVNRGRLPIT